MVPQNLCSNHNLGLSMLRKKTAYIVADINSFVVCEWRDE